MGVTFRTKEPPDTSSHLCHFHCSILFNLLILSSKNNFPIVQLLQACLFFHFQGQVLWAHPLFNIYKELDQLFFWGSNFLFCFFFFGNTTIWGRGQNGAFTYFPTSLNLGPLWYQTKVVPLSLFSECPQPGAFTIVHFTLGYDLSHERHEEYISCWASSEFVHFSYEGLIQATYISCCGRTHSIIS